MVLTCISCAFGLRVCVFQFTFSTFFFFFLPAFVDSGRQYLLLWTVYILFTHRAYTVYVLKNIKNGSRDTIYTFKNYFATVFSVFSNNKFNPNTPYKSFPWPILFLRHTLSYLFFIFRNIFFKIKKVVNIFLIFNNLKKN